MGCQAGRRAGPLSAGEKSDRIKLPDRPRFLRECERLLKAGY